MSTPTEQLYHSYIYVSHEAGFKQDCSTVEQTFNSQVIIKEELQLQHNRFHNIIAFKKAFDRVWHTDLRQVLRSINIAEGLVQLKAIWALHENSNSAILLNSKLGVFFKTMLGVHKRCLLLSVSPILFNLFLEKIIQKTLHDHHTSISIGGRPTPNLWFADLMGGINGELQKSGCSSLSLLHTAINRLFLFFCIRDAQLYYNIPNEVLPVPCTT